MELSSDGYRQPLSKMSGLGSKAPSRRGSHAALPDQLPGFLNPNESLFVTELAEGGLGLVEYGERVIVRSPDCHDLREL